MEQSVREQFQLEDRDVRNYSSLSLAFLGDAVYELVIRTFLVESGTGKPKQLDRMKKEWVKAAGVRAVKTMAQTALAMIPAAVSITEVNWVTIIGTAALAGVVSMLTSVAGLPEVEG